MATIPAAPVDAALSQFCTAAYPAHSQQMADYYRDQDRAYRLILDLHDLAPAARRDVLDFSHQPPETMHTKVAELAESAALLGQLHERIRGLNAGDLSGELQQAELVWRLAEHLAHRMAAWELSLSGGGSAARAGHLAAATAHLQWLEEWERSRNQPAYANLSRRLLRAMRSHTESLA